MFRIELKKLREERGFSQYRLAEVLGVSQSAVGLWESGKREPNFKTLCAIADFFSVSVDQLLGRADRIAGVSPSEGHLCASEAELLRKFRAVDDMAQARIMNSLDFEYRAVAQDVAKSSISLA